MASDHLACAESPPRSAPGAVAQARLGVTHSLPALLGVLPMGVAFGVLVTQSGLAWWWATAFAAVVFAGSLEFLLIGLVTVAAPLGQIAITALLVNFRHVFYALSFPLHRVHGPIAKTYSTFTLTDEAWALTTYPDAQTWSRVRILAIQATFQVGWVGSVTVGAVGGAFIPDTVVGLQFAVSAFFLVLAIDAFVVTRNLPPPLAAIGCSLAAHWLFGANMLVPALGMFLAILLVPYAFAAREEAVREP